MQLFRIVFLSCLLLQALLVHRSGAEGAGDEHIDPRALALRLRSEICATNGSQFQEFYEAVRDMEDKDIRYPANGYTLKEVQPIYWFSRLGRPLQRQFQSYFGERLENFSVDAITWCIYPLTTNISIYGCINSTHRWSTPEFEALGILDMLSLRPNSYGAGYRRGDLLIETHGQSVRGYFSTLKGAAVSCDIKVPDNVTVGGYFALDLTLDGEESSYLRDFPLQSEAYLIEGEPKNFTCSSYGDQYGGYHWYRRHGEKLIVLPQAIQALQDDNVTNSNASDLAYYELRIKEDELSNCAEYSFNKPFHNINTLIFTSPTANDTGEFLCTSDIATEAGRSLQIAVVFTKLPPEEVVFVKGSVARLTCGMKAPSNSVVYWTWSRNIQDKCLIPGTLNVTSHLDLCNNSVVSFTREKAVDDEYSMFLSELQIPDVSSDHHGGYSCVVVYKFGRQSESHMIKQNSILFVTVPPNEEITGDDGWSQIQTAWTLVGLFLLCVLVGATITVSFALWVRRLRRGKRTKRSVKFSKGQLSIKNELYNEVSLLSPGIAKPHPYEFPRNNLELQDILGEGRFGKVFMGKAYGIVPDSPNLNTVAVKTTANDQLHLSTQQLLSELEIMTKIQPHENICNLLASCTSPDGPLYVIMEYACHGNLKDYLLKCREALLERNVPIRVSSEEERLKLQQLLIGCDADHTSEVSSPSSADSDCLQFSVPSPDSLDLESKFCYDHLQPADPLCFIEEGESTAVVWSTGYDKLAPAKKEQFDGSTLDLVHDAESNAILTNLNVCDFAHQIASGLQHLEEMSVVHCDLAARNILISEGYLLKIGDFGMARYMSGDPRYQRLQAMDDSMIAVKWAAPEVLEKNLFSFKSDVWSYANIIWEIATYGSKPFADFATGLSLDPFIQHLKDGNRLSQPDGLSDSIYDKLTGCWSADPSVRPSAAELTDYFQQLMRLDVEAPAVSDTAVNMDTLCTQDN